MKKFILILLPLLSFTIFAQDNEQFKYQPAGDTLTIEEAVSLALKNNPAIKIAESGLEISESSLKTSRSVLYPQLFLQSAWTKNGGNFFNGPNVIRRDYQNFSAGFQGQQLIFDFGKTYSRISANADFRDASEQDLAATKQNLVLDTYIAYFTYLEAARIKQFSFESLKQAEEHTQQAEKFYNAGARPQFDVLKARTDQANARVNLLNAENNESVSRLQLENILNVKLHDSFVLKDILDTNKDTVAIDEALRTAFENRPELIGSKFRIDATKTLVTSAWTSNLPSINATGGYTWRSFSLDGNFLNSWNFGVVFSLPLFQGFALDAGIDLARANLKNAEAQYDNLSQAVSLDVQQQYTGLKLAIAKIDAAKYLLSQAEETNKLAEGRYREGIGSPIEITDARITLLNAQQVYIQSLYDYQVAYVRLRKAMGSLN